MKVNERFLKYVSFETMSDENSETTPSTKNQFQLANYLVEEMKSMGLSNVRVDELCYVYGELPASEGMEDKDVIGFISHMDTAPAFSGTDIKPKTIVYQGGDIELNPDLKTKESDFENLKNYIGQELIVTDGTTLLGADDKAGIAEILTAMEYLISHPDIKHGKIAVGFTPDEEIGRGADHFDIADFGAKYAYTVDGGALGGLEYENFNGAGAVVRINGVSVHPGSAKNKMKNAALMAAEFISMLPKHETPATTEGYEGFYHVCEVTGNESFAKVDLIIRDHFKDSFIERKERVKKIVEYLNGLYGEDTFQIELKDSYYNMKEKILPVMHIVEKAKEAFIKNNIVPTVEPIRGGTDGASLSFKGLPCPNLSTGGENFHGPHEFISVQSMEKMVQVIVTLASE